MLRFKVIIWSIGWSLNITPNVLKGLPYTSVNTVIFIILKFVIGIIHTKEQSLIRKVECWQVWKNNWGIIGESEIRVGIRDFQEMGICFTSILIVCKKLNSLTCLKKAPFLNIYL